MLAECILAFARETGALRRGDTFVVGVSGGVDSVALLHALRAVSATLGIALHVAHLNHGLRGLAAEQDAEFVAALAREWGLAATVRQVDVSTRAAERHLSLEAAARVERYRFFGDVVSDVGAAAVVVGHTADDQVETVLLHFLRGAGLAGLRGIMPVHRLLIAGPTADRALAVYRPLLEASRDEVELYAARHSLRYRADATNADATFTRNRVRHELLPLLKSFNPNVDQGIIRMAQLLGDDYRCLAQLADREWPTLARVGRGDVGLSLERLRELPVSIARLSVRGAYAALTGGTIDLAAEHVEQVLALALSGRTGASAELPGGVVAVRSYREVRIGLGLPAVDPLPRDGVPLRVPGTTVVGDWAVDVEVRGTRCDRSTKHSLHVDLDLEKAGTEIALRRRAHGDKMRPLGMQGSKKLQDIMVDAKVPRWERDAVPVLVSPTQILWVAGLVVCDGAAPDANTRRYLCLQLHKKGAM